MLLESLIMLSTMVLTPYFNILCSLIVIRISRIILNAYAIAQVASRDLGYI